MKYRVEKTPTESWWVEVEAANEDQAIEKAENIPGPDWIEEGGDDELSALEVDDDENEDDEEEE